MSTIPSPKPLFDTLAQLELQLEESSWAYLDAVYNLDDIAISAQFLLAYKGSQGTFNGYRREVERFLHWSFLLANKSLADLGREDIEAFIEFSQAPPKHWIGTSKPARFINENALRVPNLVWRPYVVTVSKAAHRRGKSPEIKNFELSQSSLRELFAILSSFYQYLVQEEHVRSNPFALIRQKSRFIRKSQGPMKIRRLSELQWQYVVENTQKIAESAPIEHERTLFILSALYAMYLRISELTASPRWAPQMNHFTRDGDGNWWFTTVGKGNKERQIAVSEAMLNALKRWRKHLDLSPLPSPADYSPLLPKQKGRGPITSTNHIRNIVQLAFDRAIEQLHQDNLGEEAETLHEATVHWLRHTGISDDVKVRPREHVRDDAGHSSSAITDKYIDIELRERHESARKKRIFDDEIT
ncbi:MAG: site-specific integrase [Gammaproteobacteria bacterium]|nr:site-specific integrase [Gammaproteobacteria bacterium]MCH9717917.1 site-specific integrase [Gammaproteobacteria bacterium]MCH9764149.1 site-specific integrase [Gammaproteobacteria bacterium]